MFHRPAVETDLDAYLSLIVRDPASPLTADGYRAKLADRQYRPEWTWLASDRPGGDPLAVAVWWGHPDGTEPAALDAVVVAPGAPDRVAAAAGLLAAAHTGFDLAVPPAYHVFLPGDWRERPEVRAALDWRLEAAGRAGLADRLERLRLEWTAGTPIPAPGPLTFRPEPDDEVFAGLFARVLAGTLDETSRREAGRVGARAQALGDLALYRDMMVGERSWWRVALDRHGDVVGFGLPSRNHTVPVVGYLGVLPEYRGHGYAAAILAEITRILVREAGAEVIRADTDLDNRPMAAAFAEAGYRVFARRMVCSAGD